MLSLRASGEVAGRFAFPGRRMIWPATPDVIACRAMSDTPSERRSSPRVPVRTPVTIKPSNGGTKLTGFTRDLSQNGVFFYADSEIAEGTQLEMVLILPEELTAGEKKWVCCQASVVRVQAGDGKSVGLAASIDRMDVLPQIPE